MTVATMILGLVPVLWSTGTGADVMKRIAAPMVGGLVTSLLLELAVYPAIFAIWKMPGREKKSGSSDDDPLFAIPSEDGCQPTKPAFR